MFEELKELICEYVDVDPSAIKEESRFIEDLGFNSYDFMSMVGEIEEGGGPHPVPDREPPDHG